jgi:hypothetical protein
MADVRAVVEAFQPSGGIENVGFHSSRGLQVPIGLAFEDERLGAFEEADELVGGEDWSDFDATVLFSELNTLAWLEVEFLTNLLRYDELKFG